MNAYADQVAGLRDSVKGGVWLPQDTGFDSSHIGFNLAETHRPDLVVHAHDTDDVAAVVKAAARTGRRVRVQATGHAIGVPMQDGFLIGTGRMRAVEIDPVGRRARVQAGTRWTEVIAAAAEHNLGALCGSSPDVGVVGYTVGGGMGPMARTFGFNADRVRSLTMVDAQGRIIHVDAEREPDLYWALRGGKPDFGIVTAMEFDLVDVPTYYGGGIFYPGESAGAVLHAFREWAPTMPGSASTSVALLRLPDVPEVPAPLRGRLSVHLRFVHIGDPAIGERLLAPMRAVAAPIVDMVGVTPSAAIASVHQDPTDPMPVRDDGVQLRELSAGAIDALLAVAGPGVDVPIIVLEIRLMGGALLESQGPGNAVGGRDGAWSMFMASPYPPPLRQVVEGRHAAVLDALGPWSGGTMANFLGYATGTDEVRAAWPAPIRARLDDIKRQWDPDSVFRFSYSAT